MIYRVQTKACKRCGGDLSLESDHYGTYLTCIQCGASLNMHKPTNNRHQSADKYPPKVLATAGNSED
ncbi:hypothetical protein ACFLVB_00850 [Chloroflexota bacterium]